MTVGKTDYLQITTHAAQVGKQTMNLKTQGIVNHTQLRLRNIT